MTLDNNSLTIECGDSKATLTNVNYQPARTAERSYTDSRFIESNYTLEKIFGNNFLYILS